jgi:Flp pilus assembly pilin Flp
VVLPSRSPRCSERGQALVEYAAIVALIGACLVAILGLIGRSTQHAYEQTSATMTSATAGGYGAGGGAGGGAILVGSSPARPPVNPETAGATPDSSVAVGPSDSGSGLPDASR